MKLTALFEAKKEFWLHVQQELIEAGFDDAQIVEAGEDKAVFQMHSNQHPEKPCYIMICDNLDGQSMALRIYNKLDYVKHLALTQKVVTTAPSQIARTAFNLAKLFKLA